MGKLQKKITVKSSTDNLAKVREFTRSNAAKSGFDDDTIGKIILAVDEACTNIVKHAYKYYPNGEITINIDSDKSKFKITITDSGSKFNPNEIEEPNLSEYHRKRKVGGLGMFLMKKLMDEVKYHTLSKDRNQVVLVKYIK
ncbi:MAG: ATP-binding protein [Ignavibacteriae bacterium]|nr:ATP-binding protein [Ignavibacteriota bacterium]NOG96983.1 ATP-binding protein [Ignavibacteriota bacterium]